MTPLSQRIPMVGRADTAPAVIGRPDTGRLHGFTLKFEFPVFFTADMWNPTNHVFVDAIRRLEPERQHRLVVVVDSSVVASIPTLVGDIKAYMLTHYRSLELLVEPVVVPGGEDAKNSLKVVRKLLRQMNDAGLDRQSFLVAIGGGAVLDAASFAAALCHRSVRTVRVPTTVLSQCDSGIAVKNGINLFGKKNFIGTFVPPFAVVNDSCYLETLSHRDQIAGLAEVVKVALLRDPALFDYVEKHAAALAHADITPLAWVTRQSAERHLEHICGSGDPFEFGSARPLDFGHWAAHKLESMTHHRVRHGEAVAIGMALDLFYAVKAGYLDAGCADRILTLLEALGFALWDDELMARDASGRLQLLCGLQEFREHLGGRLHVTLIRWIGGSTEVTEMDERLVLGALGELKARQARRVLVLTQRSKDRKDHTERSEDQK